MIPTNRMILFDTNVFVDYFHKNNQAAEFFKDVIDGKFQAAISPMTDFELWVGIKDREEEIKHKALLSYFQYLPINSNIARVAGAFAKPFRKTKNYSISTADFLIAATAQCHHANILTRNVEDFNALPMDEVQVISY